MAFKGLTFFLLLLTYLGARCKIGKENCYVVDSKNTVEPTTNPVGGELHGENADTNIATISYSSSNL